MGRHKHYDPSGEGSSLNLFGDPPVPVPVPKPSEQEYNIERVASAIAQAVIAFCQGRVRERPEFFADELRRYVANQNLAAPASPDRILRLMRQRGLIDYVVVSRSRSLYRVTRA